MKKNDHQVIQQLFDDYIRMYSSRDDQLTAHFSEDFSGFTGGGDFLVKQREEWVAITRQDFAQIKDPIRIEIKDLSIQSLADTIAVATGFFTINLPIDDQILSRETARLVLIFRLESAGWKITHSSISIPYHLVREGEVYPMKELVDRNQFLEKMVSERTTQLSDAKETLERINEQLTNEIAKHKETELQIHKLVQQLEVERDTAQLNAVTDSLTGLVNRRYFDGAISAEFYRLKRSGAFLSIIMVDIDHFKQFNDFYGHLAGDNCLKVVGSVLKNVICRVPDVIARYGGEEFVVMLPETDRNGAINIAEQMRDAIEKRAIPHAASATANHITISLGVVTISTGEDPVTPEQIVAMADNALYSAKKNGRNRCEFFVKSPSL
ncbi:diguanylate cyclase [Desulforhopalus sp. IMCC35007]|uniref:diguanylate cyclase n=1 Tax=Desulforhopalus sp. IMCC35007 TaxID=2569543 RepID=UPI0010AE5B02|nr:diguanylate cyclase [Desulforhopalus sp. IMCC35007]TKB11620.1 diguanylate cyclase [Desulforhopalus sp. IMCC35007]